MLHKKPEISQDVNKQW